MLYKLAFVKVGVFGPLFKDHVPVPEGGLFPANVTEVTPEFKHWSGPAFEATAPTLLFTVITTLSDTKLQPLIIFQVNV